MVDDRDLFKANTVALLFPLMTPFLECILNNQ